MGRLRRVRVYTHDWKLKVKPKREECKGKDERKAECSAEEAPGELRFVSERELRDLQRRGPVAEAEHFIDRTTHLGPKSASFANPCASFPNTY
jgi:hypothetical protein